MQIDSAKDAVTLSKESKQANIEPMIDIEEIELMMEAAQKELKDKQEQIKFLTDELQ